MARSFFFYCRREQIAAAIADGLLDYAASEQFGSVQSGDIIWIGGPGRDSELVTIGALKVADIVGQKEAERRLPYKPWSATYHTFCLPGHATVTREVDLTGILDKLRFISTRRPQLNSSRPVGQQLQSMRELTPESSKLLNDIWSEKATAATDEFSDVESALIKFDRLDQERQVIARKEQSLLREFLFRGENLGTCAICGRHLPVDFLVAAHIKPRKHCSEDERRDFANVLPMCLFGCDALFERGVLTVVDGHLFAQFSRRSGMAINKLTRSLHGRPVPAWKAERRKYFEWHAVSFCKMS